MAEEVPPEGFGTTCCTYILVVLSVVMLMVTFPFSMVMVIKVIPVYERAIIFRLGRIKGRKASGPGVFYIIPCIDKVITVDTRLKTFDVPPQSVSSLCSLCSSRNGVNTIRWRASRVCLSLMICGCLHWK